MPARLKTGVPTSVAALAIILAVAACGGSSKPRHAGSHRNVMLAFSKCMRANGVTNFPDSTGGGINLDGTGINPRTPAFQAAQKLCFRLMPGGRPQGRKASGAQIKQADETARCMRAHGVSGFPDPIITQKPPTALNPADYSSIVAGGGMIIAIPKSINEQSPAFEHAAKACGFSG